MNIETTASAAKRQSRFLVIFTLVFAGEIVFSLPFHVPRFFRSTVLDVFGFTNTQLGDIFAVYGVLAMLAYFPGGVIADHFSDRKLMTVSLVATALGGLIMARIPSAAWMVAIYGFWGVTTILLFWGALIRATRTWGGALAQGRAFGLLDGGRGLAAAAAASVAVVLLSTLLPENVSAASDEERRAGLAAVIYFYAALTFCAAALTWFFIPDADTAAERPAPFAGIVEVLRRPIVWAQAAIVICAYCGYKGLDNYSLYAVQVLGMDEVDGARLTVSGSYLRVLAPVAAGLIADRVGVGKTIAVTFFCLVVSFGYLAVASPTAASLAVIYANIAVSFFAVFAIRGVYFALLEETGTPSYLTGTAVGLISAVGFTPEIFFASITGRILDAAPGAAGHQHYFAFLAGVMLVGLLVVGWLAWLRRQAADWQLRLDS